MKTYTINGTYGSGKTKTKVFVVETWNGGKWYTCKGSVNVNFTHDEIEEGTNVEELSDSDMFTASKPINTELQLLKAVES